MTKTGDKSSGSVKPFRWKKYCNMKRDGRAINRNEISNGMYFLERVFLIVSLNFIINKAKTGIRRTKWCSQISLYTKKK